MSLVTDVWPAHVWLIGLLSAATGRFILFSVWLWTFQCNGLAKRHGPIMKNHSLGLLMEDGNKRRQCLDQFADPSDCLHLWFEMQQESVMSDKGSGSETLTLICFFRTPDSARASVIGLLWQFEENQSQLLNPKHRPVQCRWKDWSVFTSEHLLSVSTHYCSQAAKTLGNEIQAIYWLICCRYKA